MKKLFEYGFWRTVIGAGVVCVLIISGFFVLSASAHFHFFSVSGSSMEPTLKNGNAILVSEPKSPVRNELIMFRKPQTWKYLNETNDILVKRAVAVPGDTLSYNGAAFFVNGKKVFDVAKTGYDCPLGEAGYSHKLKSGEVFAFGDNWKVSLDSRRVFCDGHTDNSFVPEKLWTYYGSVRWKF